MILLGCNWSRELIQLIQEENMPVDYIKAGAYGLFEAELQNMAAMRPVLLHGLGYFERAGMRDPNIVDFTRANQLIKSCRSPHFGIHLSIRNADLDPGMSNDDIHMRMATCVNLFQKALAVPLLLENTPDSPEDRTEFDHYPYAEPEHVCRLLHETDAYLLLDLTHAKITCQFRQWDVHAYLQALPLCRVREMHVNGSEFDAGGWPIDTHRPMEDADFELLQWVLQYVSPQVVSLEYGVPCAMGIAGANINVLREQLLRLRDICGK